MQRILLGGVCLSDPAEAASDRFAFPFSTVTLSPIVSHSGRIKKEYFSEEEHDPSYAVAVDGRWFPESIGKIIRLCVASGRYGDGIHACG